MQGRPRIKGPQKSTPVFEFQGVGLDGPKEHFASNILPIDIREDVMGCFPQKLGLDLTRDEKAKIGKIKQKGAMRRISCFGSGSGRNWSWKRDSNPRPSPWQGDALPLSYSRKRVKRMMIEGGIRRRMVPTSEKNTGDSLPESSLSINEESGRRGEQTGRFSQNPIMGIKPNPTPRAGGGILLFRTCRARARITTTFSGRSAKLVIFRERRTVPRTSMGRPGA